MSTPSPTTQPPPAPVLVRVVDVDSELRPAPVLVRVTNVDHALWVRNDVEHKLHVVVRDNDMPFGSMVVFMVKWALAAIPALMILALIGWFFVFTVLAGLMALFR